MAPASELLMMAPQLLAVQHFPVERNYPHLQLLITSGDLFLSQWCDVVEHQHGCQGGEEEAHAACNQLATAQGCEQCWEHIPPEHIAFYIVSNCSLQFVAKARVSQQLRGTSAFSSSFLPHCIGCGETFRCVTGRSSHISRTGLFAVF